MKNQGKQLREKRLTSSYLYRGKIIDLRRDQVQTPEGQRTAFREIVEHPGAAAILALDQQSRVVLVRQYRHAVGEILLEVPAGRLEPGEDPIVCAQRELAEETGCRGGDWEKLTEFYSTPGFCNEIIHLFCARGVLPGKRVSADDDEALEPLWVEWDRALRLVGNGKINDAKTIIALQFATILKA